MDHSNQFDQMIAKLEKKLNRKLYSEELDVLKKAVSKASNTLVSNKKESPRGIPLA